MMKKSWSVWCFQSYSTIRYNINGNILFWNAPQLFFQMLAPSPFANYQKGLSNRLTSLSSQKQFRILLWWCYESVLKCVALWCCVIYYHLSRHILGSIVQSILVASDGTIPKQQILGTYILPASESIHLYERGGPCTSPKKGQLWRHRRQRGQTPVKQFPRMTARNPVAFSKTTRYTQTLLKVNFSSIYHWPTHLVE